MEEQKNSDHNLKNGEKESVIPVLIPAYEPDARLIGLLSNFEKQGLREVVLQR